MTEQETRCRINEIVKNRWKLEQVASDHVVRHLLYQLDDRERLKKEIRGLELQHGLLEDRIFCTRKALEFAQSKED